jgi:hypothetical protein
LAMSRLTNSDSRSWFYDALFQSILDSIVNYE